MRRPNRNAKAGPVPAFVRPAGAMGPPVGADIAGDLR